MASLLHFVPGCYVIRVHGRRWLKLTKPHTGPTEPIGWRAVTWTPDLSDAEQWPTHNTAARFVSTLRCPCEIVDVDAWTRMTPDMA